MKNGDKICVWLSAADGARSRSSRERSGVVVGVLPDGRLDVEITHRAKKNERREVVEPARKERLTLSGVPLTDEPGPNVTGWMPEPEV